MDYYYGNHYYRNISDNGFRLAGAGSYNNLTIEVTATSAVLICFVFLSYCTAGAGHFITLKEPGLTFIAVVIDPSFMVIQCVNISMALLIYTLYHFPNRMCFVVTVISRGFLMNEFLLSLYIGHNYLLL